MSARNPAARPRRAAVTAERRPETGSHVGVLRIRRMERERVTVGGDAAPEPLPRLTFDLASLRYERRARRWGYSLLTPR